MRFLADECCDASLVDALRELGHDVLYAMESLRGSSDDVVLLRAFSEDRIVVTEDKDFGELVFRLRRPAKGIVLLRFDEQEQAAKIPRLSEFVAREEQRLQGMFVVLEADKTRIRPL